MFTDGVLHSALSIGRPRVTCGKGPGSAAVGFEKEISTVSTTKINLFRHATDFVAYTPGQVVFNVGDAGDKMYAVIDGEVEIVVIDKVVDTTGPGGVIGEMALLDSAPRMATVRAKTDCKLVPVDQKRFLYLVQEAPNFALNVMRIMAERLRKARP